MNSTATLTVPERTVKGMTVKLELELRPEESEKLEAALAQLNKPEGDDAWYGKFYEVHALMTTLKDLREQAERVLGGLRFTSESKGAQ